MRGTIVLFFGALAFIYNHPATSAVAIPATNDPVCNSACGLHGSGCSECTDRVFSCPKKKLTGICLNYFNDNTTSIVDVNVEDNALSDFSSFPQRSNITQLKLANNNFTAISKADLARFPLLLTLDLSHNPLQSLNEDVFEALGSLTTLHLHTAELFEVPANIFKGNKQLIVLDLQGNKFASFPKEIFRLTPKLTSLNFNENPVSRIEADDFKYLDHLEYLQLERLDINQLKAHTFSSLTHLREISLEHNNNLNFIDEDAFGLFSREAGKTTAALEKVTLRGCAFQSLDEHTFNYLGLKEIGLSANPWVCDCTIKWMADKKYWSKAVGRTKILDELNRTKCHDLIHLDKPIIDVPLEFFICRGEDRKAMLGSFSPGVGGVTTVLVVSLLVCIVSVILAVILFKRCTPKRNLAPHPHTASQYRAIYNQGSVQSHENDFVDKEKDPFEL